MCVHALLHFQPSVLINDQFGLGLKDYYSSLDSALFYIVVFTTPLFIICYFRKVSTVSL